FSVCILLLITVSIAFTPSLPAQSAGTGAVTGTVRDSSGGVIPGVMVTLTSADTNQTRTTITGEEGSYRFALLPPGNYAVRFSLAGFKTSEVSSATVRVTETLVIDKSLEVGAQGQEVTVEAQTEVLQTATSTLGATVGAATVTQLPLSTRNYTQILALSAGLAGRGVKNRTDLANTDDAVEKEKDPPPNNKPPAGHDGNTFLHKGHPPRPVSTA